ncbi:uncharacterized protein PpBr36_10934 [Pyricularia pennisetigena]|uniref:uncharacterized protein n=1 Tax=Pyricularia pennisetigena TaxID=1578925 RepID=UPI00115374DC|nr:uncharacterized protein PpBr36_10934 [Pyricularia pennisetigena]TLS20737.1 hypothetical protein PpBr36_10934 [Pyricularia pennisetigena]
MWKTPVVERRNDRGLAIGRTKLFKPINTKKYSRPRRIPSDGRDTVSIVPLAVSLANLPLSHSVPHNIKGRDIFAWFSVQHDIPPPPQIRKRERTQAPAPVTHINEDPETLRVLKSYQVGGSLPSISSKTSQHNCASPSKKGGRWKPWRGYPCAPGLFSTRKPNNLSEASKITLRDLTQANKGRRISFWSRHACKTQKGLRYRVTNDWFWCLGQCCLLPFCSFEELPPAYASGKMVDVCLAIDPSWTPQSNEVTSSSVDTTISSCTRLDRQLF